MNDDRTRIHRHEEQRMSNYESRHTPETGPSTYENSTRMDGLYENAPKGPSTYLHAGASKIGWPHDHSVDDTYECPPHTWTPGQELAAIRDKNAATAEDTFCVPPIPPPQPMPGEHQYTAEFRGDGSAVLVLYSSKLIAEFDTIADAKLAAEALNNHKGY